MAGQQFTQVLNSRQCIYISNISKAGLPFSGSCRAAFDRTVGYRSYRQHYLTCTLIISTITEICRAEIFTSKYGFAYLVLYCIFSIF